MKNLSLLFKWAAVAIGILHLIMAFFSTSDVLGMRIAYGFVGLLLLLAALIPLVRRFIFTFVGFFFAYACIYGLITDASTHDSLIIMLLFVAIFLTFGMYNGYHAYKSIRHSSSVVKLLQKLGKPEAPIEPALSMSDAPLETDEDGNVLIRTAADWQKFHAQYTPIRTYYTKVVGVTFKNKDSTDRQSILSRCNNRDEVSLEPFTYRGDPAYAVWTRHGQIGNLSADDAAMISTVYADFVTLAEIKEITGGKRGQCYGCNLILTVYQPKSETQPVPEKPDDIELPENAELTESLIYAAVDVILETGQASVSVLQSHLRCGYATAARIIVELEDAGVIGPYRGSQTPAILLTRAGWEALNYHYPPQFTACDDVDPAFIAEAQWHAARNDDK